MLYASGLIAGIYISSDGTCRMSSRSVLFSLVSPAPNAKWSFWSLATGSGIHYCVNLWWQTGHMHEPCWTKAGYSRPHPDDTADCIYSRWPCQRSVHRRRVRSSICQGTYIWDTMHRAGSRGQQEMMWGGRQEEWVGRVGMLFGWECVVCCIGAYPTSPHFPSCTQICFSLYVAILIGVRAHSSCFVYSEAPDL